MATTAEQHPRPVRLARNREAPDAFRRELRVRLLKDLVDAGLYRVNRDVLADRLIEALHPRGVRT